MHPLVLLVKVGLIGLLLRRVPSQLAATLPSSISSVTVLPGAARSFPVSERMAPCLKVPRLHPLVLLARVSMKMQI